jgi:glycosyltransferase involved in cell wall biosynthesis
MALIRREQPALLQTWMYHADLLGSIATRVGPPVPVIWGIRRSALDPLLLKPATYAAGKLCAAMSGWLPAPIVCCSETALEGHVRKGYRRGRMSVIPNGFDVARFQPDPMARTALRDELGLAAEAQLVGLAGRFDPQKDHRSFVRAAGILAQRSPAHFLMCGSGVDRDNRELARWLRAAGCAERVHLLGLRRDMPRIIAALDIAVSSSISEGFPNVVGEAMACAVPCVVTDVGDSARIVDDTGWVVPPADPPALAAAIAEVLALSTAARTACGERARRRIAAHYSVTAVAARYGALYRSVLERASRS